MCLNVDVHTLRTHLFFKVFLRKAGERSEVFWFVLANGDGGTSTTELTFVLLLMLQLLPHNYIPFLLTSRTSAFTGGGDGGSVALEYYYHKAITIFWYCLS